MHAYVSIRRYLRWATTPAALYQRAVPAAVAPLAAIPGKQLDSLGLLGSYLQALEWK